MLANNHGILIAIGILSSMAKSVLSLLSSPFRLAHVTHVTAVALCFPPSVLGLELRGTALRGIPSLFLSRGKRHDAALNSLLCICFDDLGY